MWGSHEDGKDGSPKRCRCSDALAVEAAPLGEQIPLGLGLSSPRTSSLRQVGKPRRVASRRFTALLLGPALQTYTYAAFGRGLRLQGHGVNDGIALNNGAESRDGASRARRPIRVGIRDRQLVGCLPI